MTLLLAALLTLQQSDEELRALVEQFDKTTDAREREGHPSSPWYKVHRAGPAILKPLAAAFPGRSQGRNVECGTCGWSPEGEYPLVRLMLSFGDRSLPVLLSLLKDPDPAKARIAAAVMCRFSGQEIVGPLLDLAKRIDLSKDPDVDRHVAEALANATFLKFKSRAELSEWFDLAKHRSQVAWLREAINHPDRERANRDSSIKGIQRLLEAPDRLKTLIHCYADLEWREARVPLHYLTGHGNLEKWDPRDLVKERADWKVFRDRSIHEQELEIALHVAFLSGASLPAPYLSKDRGEKLLLENAEKALDYLERIAPEHPQCEFGFNIALQYIATARNWDRAVALLPKAKPGFNFLSQLLENSRHPSMADKMLDMVIAGEAETMNFRGLMTELPKRVRPDMAPKILESIPKTTGRNRSTLLSALGRTADPRGWDILEREIFNDLPNAAQAAEILEYFPGERALVALRKLLKSTNYQGFPHAARILADRGDHSGIPALIERLQTTTVDVEKRWYMGALAAIRGQSLPKLADYSTPPNTGVFLDEYWAWWQKNKSRSRVEWLLESLEEGLGVHPYPPHPLLILAQEDARDVPADWPEERRRNEIVKRVRAWIAKTGFAFTKDNVRVHEPAKRELGR